MQRHFAGGKPRHRGPRPQGPQEFFKRVFDSLYHSLDQHGKWELKKNEQGAAFLDLQSIRLMRFHIVRCANTIFFPRKIQF